MVMTFGEWLRAQRDKNSWTIRDLTDDTQLALSTVSRIENDESSPSLDTVVLLLDIFGYSHSELYQALTDRPLPPPPPAPETPLPANQTPSLDEILALGNAVIASPEKGLRLFCVWLNEIYRYDDPDMDEAFTPSLLQTILCNTNNHLFRFKYPIKMKPETILSIYQQDGAILAEDAINFVDLTNPRKSFERGTARIRYPWMEGFPRSVRHRYLSDLIKLNYPEYDYQIFSMFLRATDHEMFMRRHFLSSTLRSTLRSLGKEGNVRMFLAVQQLMGVYMFIRRWQAYYGIARPTWPEDLKQVTESHASSSVS